jgi:hypothetical protein
MSARRSRLMRSRRKQSSQEVVPLNHLALAPPPPLLSTSRRAKHNAAAAQLCARCQAMVSRWRAASRIADAKLRGVIGLTPLIIEVGCRCALTAEVPVPDRN